MQKFNQKKSFHKRLGENCKSDFLMNYQKINVIKENKFKTMFNNVLQEINKTLV